MSDNCCCGKSKTIKTDKKIVVEYMYLDLKTCTRCVDNMYVLERTLYKIIPTLALAGYKVDLRRIEITDEEVAKEHHFISSPTIRVNGYDICDTVTESDCDCCSDICNTDVNCRVFEYEGEKSEVVPESMIIEKIMKYSSSEPAVYDKEYVMPENLKRFFSGKKKDDGINIIKKRCC